MKNKPVIVVSGEPYSVFLEIFFKVFKSKFINNYNKPIILIASKKLVEKQMKKMNYSFKINQIYKSEINKISMNNKSINLIDIRFNFNKTFDKISDKSNKYIEECFSTALNSIKNKKGISLINGPISKKNFLKEKFLGITEYLAHKTNSKDIAMLIYNKKLSVSPITTHLPIKHVSQKLSKKKISSQIKLIKNFYKKNMNKNPKFAITGLNPHCESYLKSNEEDKIIKPAIKKLVNEKIKIDGPFSADTIFQKKNVKKYDVIIGMYHDQVLTPIKTLYGFSAINITVGLPFVRITPDHGPNNQMLGKNKSDPTSLKEALTFLKKINGN